MALQGITFDAQTVTPKADGGKFQKIYSDGYLNGCTVTYTAGTINISPGYIIMAGRHIRIISTETIDVTPLVTDGVARLKLVIDLSRTSTQVNFEQAYFEVDYAVSPEALPALVQGNINYSSDQKYEMAYAALSVEGSSLTGITQEPPEAKIIGADENAMPKSGGTFTGNVKANSEVRMGAYLRNAEIHDVTGTPTSSNSLIFLRK